MLIISWNTTNQCNLYCDHCYRDAGIKNQDELSTAEGKKLLDEIAQAGFKIMIFSGGEPLMREDICELVSYASSLGLRPVLGTNGTLLDLKTVERLKKAGVLAVGISLDSMTKDHHDQLRRYPGAWEQAVRGMRVCCEVGLPFQVNTTIFNWNYKEVLRITDMAVKMGAIAHHFFFLVPTGRAVRIEAETISAREYEILLRKILQKQCEVEIELKPTCAPQFMRIAKQMGLHLRFGRGCLAGISYCIVNPRGIVQPCAYLNIPVGNVREVSFSSIWKESSIFKMLRTRDYQGKCGTCSYQEVCGGCRARAYVDHGNYMDEDSWCLHGRSGS